MLAPMPPTPPPLSVHLLALISRQTAKEFRRRAQHTGMTQAQARVLLHLSWQPGMTQVTLAELLDVHPVSVTQIVDRLVKAGWVRRAPHERDRRAFSLYLTEAAEPHLEELVEITNATDRAALRGFSAAERRQLDAMLGRIRDNLGQQQDDTAAA